MDLWWRRTTLSKLDSQLISIRSSEASTREDFSISKLGKITSDAAVVLESFSMSNRELLLFLTSRCRAPKLIYVNFLSFYAACCPMLLVVGVQRMFQTKYFRGKMTKQETEIEDSHFAVFIDATRISRRRTERGAENCFECQSSTAIKSTKTRHVMSST